MSHLYKLTIALLMLVHYAWGASAVLAWDANPETNIAGYKLSVGTAGPDGKIEWTREIDVVDGKVETDVHDLMPGETYHFAVLAYNTHGQTGPMSDVITYTIPVPPSAPGGLRVVEIQTSANLEDWQTIAMIPQHPEGKSAEFVRARIATIPPAK